VPNDVFRIKYGTHTTLAVRVLDLCHTLLGFIWVAFYVETVVTSSVASPLTFVEK